MSPKIQRTIGKSLRTTRLVNREEGEWVGKLHNKGGEPLRNTPPENASQRACITCHTLQKIHLPIPIITEWPDAPCLDFYTVDENTKTATNQIRSKSEPGLDHQSPEETAATTNHRHTWQTSRHRLIFTKRHRPRNLTSQRSENP